MTPLSASERLAAVVRRRTPGYDPGLIENARAQPREDDGVFAMDIAPGQTMTFTVKRVPDRIASRKTIRRLMRMQPDVQKGLRKLAKRRARFDNRDTNRGGRIWVDRAKTTKLTYVKKGETFTLLVTPQIIPDIKSVADCLDVSKA